MITKSGRIALVVAFVLTLIFVGVVFYLIKDQEHKNEMRAFQNAVNSSEPLVLQNYLDMYEAAPSAHRDSILLLLNRLKMVDVDWATALSNNSKQGYVKFLELHPQSVYSIEAGIRIDSLDWNKAIIENTVEAFQSYINEHHDGAYYDEALVRYDEALAFKLQQEAQAALQADSAGQEEMPDQQEDIDITQ